MKAPSYSVYRNAAVVPQDPPPVLPEKPRWMLALLPLLWSMFQAAWTLWSWPRISVSLIMWTTWAIGSVQRGEAVVWFALGQNMCLAFAGIVYTIVSGRRVLRLIRKS